MKREVHYCRSHDGVAIAYATLGSGPVVLMPPSFQSLTYRLGDMFTQLTDALSSAFTVVTYDGRGMGLSDRAATDFSLEARLSDLDAVVTATTDVRFSILARLYSVPVTIAYAARHPERIDRIALVGGYADGARYYRESDFGQVATALSGITTQQWEFVSQTIIARGALPDTPADVLERRAAAMRESWTAENVLKFRAANQLINVEEDLGLVRAPTLIVTTGALTGAASRDMASRIRGARLLDATARWDGWDDEDLRQMLEFLGATAPYTSKALGAASGGVQTVLFTDLVGHTEMMQRLGDARGRDVLREHERITRDVLKRHGGAELKTMGDGFMASFGSVTAAIDCAIGLQRAFHAQNEGPGTENLNVRVGLNAGEPIAEDGDLFGSTVILASRIAAQAGAGEILIPETLRHLLSGKSYDYTDRGEIALKGFEDALRLYEVRWQEGDAGG